MKHYFRFFSVSIFTGLFIFSAPSFATPTNPWIDSMESLAKSMAEEYALAAARSVCYSGLSRGSSHSLIMIPLPNSQVDLDSLCHSRINNGWHAGGVAKPRYYHQDCHAEINNRYYGGGYTSFVEEAYFESNSGNYPNCNATNAFVCCSPQFPNQVLRKRREQVLHYIYLSGLCLQSATSLKVGTKGRVLRTPASAKLAPFSAVMLIY